MKATVLQDVSSTGRARPWKNHKINNELLSSAYQDVNPDKALRLENCCTRLSFAIGEGGAKKLVGAHFCRVRLCPICSWRRSLKVAAQMTQIMNAIKQDQQCQYILVTFTMRNCTPNQLNQDLTNLIQGFARLVQRKTVANATLGFYRAVEVTHNLKEDTYHPHIHAIFAVDPLYFKKSKYLKQEQWTSLWKQALNVDYNPIVDVRKIHGETAAAVAEVAKYAVKSSDYIIPDDWDLTVQTIRILDPALHNRRFISFGGIFKDYHYRLHLDDADKGNLLDLGPTAPLPDADKVIHFAWFSGYRQYCQD